MLALKVHLGTAGVSFRDLPGESCAANPFLEDQPGVCEAVVPAAPRCLPWASRPGHTRSWGLGPTRDGCVCEASAWEPLSPTSLCPAGEMVLGVQSESRREVFGVGSQGNRRPVWRAVVSSRGFT